MHSRFNRAGRPDQTLAAGPYPLYSRFMWPQESDKLVIIMLLNNDNLSMKTLQQSLHDWTLEGVIGQLPWFTNRAELYLTNKHSLWGAELWVGLGQFDFINSIWQVVEEGLKQSSKPTSAIYNISANELINIFKVSTERHSSAQTHLHSGMCYS